MIYPLGFISIFFVIIFSFEYTNRWKPHDNMS